MNGFLYSTACAAAAYKMALHCLLAVLLACYLFIYLFPPSLPYTAPALAGQNISSSPHFLSSSGRRLETRRCLLYSTTGLPDGSKHFPLVENESS